MTTPGQKELYERLLKLEGAVEVLTAMVAEGGKPSARQVGSEGSIVVAMRGMSAKQHAAMQMVMAGCSNAEIAERFSVSESTAKAYVRGMMRRLEVKTRGMAILRAKAAFDAMDEDLYREVSRGLSKTWHSEFKKSDPVNKWLMTTQS